MTDPEIHLHAGDFEEWFSDEPWGELRRRDTNGAWLRLVAMAASNQEPAKLRRAAESLERAAADLRQRADELNDVPRTPEERDKSRFEDVL